MEFDLDNPPPLSDADKAQLAFLASRPDSEIDTSDIPEADEAFFKNAVRGMFRAAKTQVTIRIDQDVLAWLKAGGSGYQTKLNYLLRKAMQQEQRDAKQRLASP